MTEPTSIELQRARLAETDAVIAHCKAAEAELRAKVARTRGLSLPARLRLRALFVFSSVIIIGIRGLVSLARLAYRARVELAKQRSAQ